MSISVTSVNTRRALKACADWDAHHKKREEAYAAGLYQHAGNRDAWLLDAVVQATNP